jgi:perosamine synthetase
MSNPSTQTRAYVPLSRPLIDEETIAAVGDVIRSGWITTGPKTVELEKVFGAYVGAPFVLAVNSATSALHLGLAAADIGPGDEVLVPTMTFAATAEVVAYCGATPVLVDCEHDTMCIDVADAAKRITPKTRAIMPVHFAGIACDMPAILTLAKQHNLLVVEDAAHALPTDFNGKRIGSWTAEGVRVVTAFSFYANKNVTSGEGGMVTMHNEALFQRMQTLRLHGLSRDAWKRFRKEGSWYYEIVEPGFKYNPSDILSVIALHQMKRADEFLDRRHKQAEIYADVLGNEPTITLPADSGRGLDSWHLYVARLKLDKLTIDRKQFLVALAAAEVGHGVHYIPLHEHPYYRERFGYTPESLPVAHGLSGSIVSLPLSQGLTEDEVRQAAERVRDVLHKHTT